MNTVSKDNPTQRVPTKNKIVAIALMLAFVAAILWLVMADHDVAIDGPAICVGDACGEEKQQ